MSPIILRRSFLGYMHGAVLALLATRVMASPSPQNPPPNNSASGGTPAKPGGGGTSFPGNGQGNTPRGGGGPGPSPAAAEGDTQPTTRIAPKDDPTKTKKDDPNKVLRSDERDIRSQVRQLAEYVAQLKQEIEKTDSTRVLSMDILRKTKDIERLAHHIASLEKG